MRSIPGFCLLFLSTFSAASSADLARPVPVSPGAADAAPAVRDPCPTFSWGALPGARGYELVVLKAGAESAQERPALRARIAGSATSWTPSLDQCLAPGRYAWSLRAEDGQWSEPRLFEVGPSPGDAELERLVERAVARWQEKEAQRKAQPARILPPAAGGARPLALFADSHFTPPACEGVFSDVTAANPFCPWIEQSFADGIASSCATGPLRYCPQDSVTRQLLAMEVERGVQERWGLSGNGGTTAGTHFLGTTDDTAFDIRVHGERALRISPETDISLVGVIPNLIGGWKGNSISPGASPLSSVLGGVIGGGGRDASENHVRDSWGVVAGGLDNHAGSADGNPDDARFSTVSGGVGNVANADGSTVGGGSDNTASNFDATVSGGFDNIASGDDSMIPGGSGCEATGSASFAAGVLAKANGNGSFAWADDRPFDFTVNTDNRFGVRATGGVRLVLAIDSNGAATWDCVVTDGNSWSCSSDRNLKNLWGEVEGEDILARLASVPIYRWSAKSGTRKDSHLGPTAQDFHAAFGVGDDDTHISTIDLDGVALAAIQGLQAELERRDRDVTLQGERIVAQEKEIAELRAEIHASGARPRKSSE